MPDHIPVIFEFAAAKDFHFAAAFGDRFGMPVSNDRVELPDALGTGFIQEMFVNNGLSLCMHQYVLQQPLILKRLAGNLPGLLAMKFDCRKLPMRSNDASFQSLFADSKGAEVEFGTSNFFTEMNLPADQEITFLVVSITRHALIDLLNLQQQGRSIEHILKDNPSFVFHESLTLEMERTLQELAAIHPDFMLASLLYQTKAQELIYHLFTKLLSRTTGTSVSVNEADIKKIYAVRAAIMHDLSVVPRLAKLAVQAGMSQTKMKQLFQQVFGKSIYNYYQVERMSEAARLLRDLSVSETGYRIGFSNLSHFSRLFEKHHHVKPKRYKEKLKAA